MGPPRRLSGANSIYIVCVIYSSSNLEYRAGASVPDPKSDHSHMADALGYACIALQKGLLPWSVGVTGFRVS